MATVQLSLSTQSILSQLQAVGHGFNIFGTLDERALVAPLFDYTAAPTHKILFLGQEYEVPDFIVLLANPDSYTEWKTCMTRDEYQSSLAAHVGANVSWGAFRGEMSADYVVEQKNASEYAYAYYNHYRPLGTVELKNVGNYITEDFRNAVSALPATLTPANARAFLDFFEFWGVYYVRRATLGGRLKLLSSVLHTSELRKEEIDMAFEAHYKGLFASGSFDSSITSKQQWQRYKDFSRTTIRAQGGDASCTIQLEGLVPMQPGKDTSLKALQEWVRTLEARPALVDFALDGIWNLCGSRRALVREAWEQLGRNLQPRLVARTFSALSAWPIKHPIATPVITLERDIIPAQPPETPAGFQIVVVDGGRLGARDAVLLNRFFTAPAVQQWGPVYTSMYDDMVAALQADPALTREGNLLIAAGFGIDRSMVPTAAAIQLFRSAGADQRLDRWRRGSRPGKQHPDAGLYVGFPLSYLLVGFFGSMPGTGFEDMPFPHQDGYRVRATIDFYLQSVAGKYQFELYQLTRYD